MCVCSVCVWCEMWYPSTLRPSIHNKCVGVGVGEGGG